MSKSIIIIPARYASTRFPGKPLALLGGQPIIQWVVERARTICPKVVVATDNIAIKECVENFGGEVVMTAETHTSGTDRVIEAYELLGEDFDIVINLQGDEPFVQTNHIEQLIRAFDDKNTQIATLCEALPATTPDSELCNPNIVKLVRGEGNFALYFSRLPIPCLRGVKDSFCCHHTYYRHIGLYAFKAEVLSKLKQLPPSPLELAESLEQLRWLSANYRIRVMQAEGSTIGIDTPEDLERAEAYLRR